MISFNGGFYNVFRDKTNDCTNCTLSCHRRLDFLVLYSGGIHKEMKYTFHLCQPDSRLPKVTGWYLELQPDDTETLFLLHKGVAGLYFSKFGKDPHITKDADCSILYNPVKLAASWLLSIESYLLAGRAVLVNSQGGFMPMHNVKILDTVQSDDISWDERYDNEIITVSRWPEGRHYYLCSSRNRMFVPDHYNTFQAAEEEALRYVPKEHIRTRNC